MYLELESWLLNKEMACNQDGSQEGDTEAFALTYRNNSCRSYGRSPMNKGGFSSNSYQGGYNSSNQRGSHNSSRAYHSFLSGRGSNSSGGGLNLGGGYHSGGDYRNKSQTGSQGGFDTCSNMGSNYNSGGNHYFGGDRSNKHRQNTNGHQKSDLLEQEL
jgi:hypothetical protein